MKGIAKFLYKYRYFLLSFITGLTLFFGFSINIETDNSLKAWFSEKDPNYILYENYRAEFDEGRFLLVVLKSENIFTLDVLNYIKQKTEELESIAQVDGVYSLANSNKVIGTSEGLEIQPLLSELDSINLYRIRKYALQDELFKNYLISPDGNFTAIVINFKDMSFKEGDQTIFQIEEILGKNKPVDVDIYSSGDRKAMSEFNKYTKQTQELFLILIILIICISIYILFRSFYKTFIILINIGISLCWTLGFYSVLGFTFNVITVLLVPLITVLSIADCVHIIKYFDEVRGDFNKEGALISTIEYITIPCFITSITTAFGLLSLSVSRINAVRYFGIGSAAGIMFAFLVSIITVPFFLTSLPIQQIKEKGFSWDNILNSISNFNKKNYKKILTISVLIFTVAFWGVKQIKIETNQFEWFPKKGDFYKSTLTVQDNLSGVDNLEVMIEGKEDLLKRPDILIMIDKLTSEIGKLPHVKKVISLTDYVKRIHKVLHEDNPYFYKIPDSQSLIAQELFLFTLSDSGLSELYKFVTPDYSKGRISIKTKVLSSEESIKLGNIIERKAKEIFSGTEVQITMTGTLYLYNLNQKYLLESQIKSIILSFLSVIGFLFFMFRSAKYGFFSILPNLLPIILILGVMGWAGIDLNIATVMVAPIALGIVVDDTVHFITRFRKEHKFEHIALHEVLRKTTNSVGNAIIFTSLINIMGFLILLISRFQPTRQFGFLISLTLFFALIGDLVLLPTSMIACRKLFIKNSRS